jgi:hypothetical protein
VILLLKSIYMIALDIDETTEIGQRILREVQEHPEAGRIGDFKIPRDENGVPIGFSVEEVFEGIDRELSEWYGVDFMKVDRMIEAGELREEDLTNELLLSPEFEYKPYPDFKPTPPSDDFVPDPAWADVISEWR